MADLNPYEPSQPPEPLKRAQVVKRWLDFGMILLLIPVAIHVALFVSGTATLLMIYATQIAGAGPPRTAVMIIVLCGPPLATMVAMIWWAVGAYRRNQRTMNVRG